MNFDLTKVLYLNLKTFALGNKKIIRTGINKRIFAKSSYSFQIMSNNITNGPILEIVIQNETTRKEEKFNESLIKSENDSMEYRLIQLDNGLKALLISDVSKIIDLNTMGSGGRDSENESDVSEDSGDSEVSGDESESSLYEMRNEPGSEEEDREVKHVAKEAEEKMAACALCVGVGSFSDPPDIPGLAHFLEHMVFMGSSKYPQENGFEKFIKKHGGSDNGSTECETTTFYLECSEKYLKKGMNLFAQFFISPLMKREAMTREREIINSEFEMSLPSDSTRREQILGSLAPPNHPAGKFLWGNLTTLGTNVEDEVLYERVHEFRKRHYSAHRMTVAVQGRLPLDTLEEYVRDSFSDIPRNGLPPDDFSEFIGSYGAPENFNKIVWVKPVKDICQIHLTWVLPSYTKEYKSRPLDYVAWFIGHEGEGSLLSLLRKRIWALECEAGNDESGFEHNSIYALFSVSLTLTEEGYKHINEIISLVFSYIAMLKVHCPNKAKFDELRTVCETNFAYKTEIPSASYVEILAESMHFYEPKHYIVGGELFLEYKPKLITEVLNQLTADRINIIIYSKENPDSFYDRVEPWFQTKHKIEDIPPEWKKKWLESRPIDEFHIPHPNPYLVTDFSRLPQPNTNPPYPEKILDNDLLELWYRQDVKFKQPLAYFSFYIISPLLNADPLNVVLLDVLTSYFETKFTEQIFSANEAGLYCTNSSGNLGLFLQFSGFNQKLPLLFDQFLKLIQKCRGEIGEEKNREFFNVIKTGRSRTYYNQSLKPKKLVKMARLTLLLENCSTSIEHYNLMSEVTPEKLSDFARDFFGNVRICGLIQGNISRETSLEICEKFEKELGCSPLTREKPQVRVTKLNQGELYLRVKSVNESDSNSVIVNYYQVGQGNIRTSCMIDLLIMIMDEPLFDSLRTKQQIGYDVHCLFRDTFGILAFSVTVFFQSHKFEADEVDDRIETFLKTFSKTLKSMPKKEWEEIKSSLVSLKSRADLQLYDEVNRNFAEIHSGEYIFDRLQKEVEIIPDIGHKEFCTWFTDLIANGKSFRKLSVQVIGDSQKNPEPKDSHHNKALKLTTLVSNNTKRQFFITDLTEYKKRREFYPVYKKSV